MSSNLGRDEMLAMLHELDAALEGPLGIVICGGAAAILSYGLRRQSLDVDVLNSTVSLERPGIKKAIENIGAAHSKSSIWLNDHAKKVYEYLPENYTPDTQPLAGFFKKLQPVVIEKADFVITKLAYYEKIRLRDSRDIEEVIYNQDDILKLYRKLDALAKKDHVRALLIEANFKEFKPEWVRDKDGFRFHRAETIAKYVEVRYGLMIPETEQQEWEDELVGMTSTSSGIIARLDRKMAESIKLGDKDKAKRDFSYREKQRSVE